MSNTIFIIIVVISFCLYKLNKKNRTKKKVHYNLRRKGKDFIEKNSIYNWSVGLNGTFNLDSQLKFNSPMIQFDNKNLSFDLNIGNSNEGFLSVNYWRAHETILDESGWQLCYYSRDPVKLIHEFYLENPESLKQTIKLGDKFCEVKRKHPEFNREKILNEHSEYLYSHTERNFV